jgi:hypothetical protein
MNNIKSVHAFSQFTVCSTMVNFRMIRVETCSISTFVVKMEKHDATVIHTYSVISCTANHQSECTKLLPALISHQKLE